MGRTAPAALVLMGPVTSPPRLDSPETAVAAGIVLEHFAERSLVEIRPVRFDEHQLGIRTLPKQEVGKTLLAAGADDDVRIRDSGRVERPPDRLFGDVLGLEATCRDERGD